MNIYSSKRVLKSRLLAAKGFEDAFQSFVAQDRSAGNWASQTANLLLLSKGALSVYVLLGGLAQKAYDAAVEAYDAARRRFEEDLNSLKNLEKGFKNGIDKYTDDQKFQAAKDIALGVVELFGAIAATVATGGLAAPLAIGAGAEVASTAAEIVKTLKKIYDTVKTIHDKLQPVIKKLKALAESINKMLAVVAQAKALREIDFQRPNMKSDISNGTAMWRIMRVEVDEMEIELKALSIDGKSAYFKSLKMLGIYGETYLQTQENLVQRGNDSVVVQLKTEL